MTTTHRQIDQLKAQAVVVPLKSQAGNATLLKRSPSVRILFSYLVIRSFRSYVLRENTPLKQEKSEFLQGFVENTRAKPHPASWRGLAARFPPLAHSKLVLFTCVALAGELNLGRPGSSGVFPPSLFSDFWLQITLATRAARRKTAPKSNISHRTGNFLL